MFVVLSVLLIVACLVPAAGKLAGQPKMRHAAAHFGVAWHRYRLIGIAELAAAAGVLAGLLWRPAGLLAAVGMTLLLLGALAVHGRARDRIRDAVPALGALAIALGYLTVA